MSARHQPFRKLFRVAPWYIQDSRVARVKQFLVSDAEAEPGVVPDSSALQPPAVSASSATAMKQLGQSKFIGKQVDRVQNSSTRYAGNVFVRPAEEASVLNQGAKYLLPSPFEYQNSNDYIRQFGYARIRR